MPESVRFEPNTPKLDGTAKRVWLKRGKVTRKLLLVVPPYPEKGDELTIDGEAWFVARIQDEKIIAAFDRDGNKLRQVFP